MAEEAPKPTEAVAPAKKKKKIKLPLLMLIALMLIGGGFYVISTKGKGHKKEVPKIELADKDTELEEFLTNTANPQVYVRTKISVRLKKGFDEGKFKDATGDVRDAVLLVLNATQPTDITDASKRLELRKRIADAINDALKADQPPDAKDKDKTGVKPIVPPDCDSDTGPVMKVRFSSLATQ